MFTLCIGLCEPVVSSGEIILTEGRPDIMTLAWQLTQVRKSGSILTIAPLQCKNYNCDIVGFEQQFPPFANEIIFGLHFI